MRLVQVLIPAGKRQPVLAALDEEGIDYAVWDETGRRDFEALVQFPVPPIGVEPVLERLRKAGVSENTYTIVLAPETVVSKRIETLKRRYSGTRISREELTERAENLAPETSTYLAFLILSTVIATGGLLLDSAATIIGAMVVAPLMGPAISASVGTVLDNRKLASRGIRLQAGGLLLAIAIGALLGTLLRESILLPPGLDIREISQVAERTSPNFLSLFLALGSGIAGAISIIRGAGSALVGVAIAIALVPPAATSGLGIAWGLPGVAIAAAVLVLVNLLAVNVSALIMLWVSGFRPAEAEAIGHARSSVILRAVFLVSAIALLSIALGLVTYASFQTTVVEQEINAEIVSMFQEPEYDEIGLTLEGVAVDYRPAALLLGEPVQVSVLVGRSAGQEVPPDIARKANTRLTEATGEDIEVRVGFVESQRFP
ncbi:TIGR00341 family protein [Methanosarcina hadiensis]|uniref:TIGR00341 family protein n=1 Tax=Methanosarcina hadiensis TaxID=3078083 RepID=UPI0039778BC8